MRPRVKGPLSVTRTITCFPFMVLVTFSIVPKGYFLWAQVSESWCIRSPLAVRAPVERLE